MEITSVKLRRIDDKKGSLLAVCSVLLDNSFLVKNIKLVRIKEKYIVAMPNEKIKEKYEDICNPITSDLRDKFNKAIINKYLESN